MNDNEKFCTFGKSVIITELRAIRSLQERINEAFSTACKAILACEGRVAVLGIGKSGCIARKISATLSSTGTPSFYVHPGEASHGDIGMITTEDIALVISYSGETPEIIHILPFIQKLEIPIIAFTGKLKSNLACIADIVIDVSVNKEACPLGLAPTSSTTATLIMGDALAITLFRICGFTTNDFARVHPGGSLGKRLFLNINNIMHTNDRIPLVKSDCMLDEALVEITKKSLGMTAVIDENGDLVGVFTDNDLRKTIDRGYDIRHTPIKQVMSNGITIHPKLLATEALGIMRKHKINSLVVVDNKYRPVGVVNMYDLLQAGII
ncbi:KpsF/GutQ family sugar-phosphate isomerase [Coxiella endosymbiont of Amblyomma americanum]|uniref:KpsF/GutQ family sugar-phosphate isomerase n=1 Tax=Coxiella endosymbiont of Amblyomma americanum TaxID=325775 RepID=UPI00058091A2|nr:KpsF/GutQ family sugar-phosphate isomerase [Coxiella endosymbiont of Amblyomma americanum]AJC50349.1 D-arabinose 5-phosphate isomerase [Coxiella endosymbiont of Amblyomma americanum]AUJ58696.1 D-arabinose 5-phosphate isomerase [Coxiella-like endosymbiont of Amblyomma americanum]